jgi:hypothetical protein
MVVSIPPKYSVSQVVKYMKGNSAIWVARAMGRNRIAHGFQSVLNGLQFYHAPGFAGGISDY